MAENQSSGRGAETETSDLAALVRRCEEGDNTALSEARELFDRSPQLWDEVGDLAVQAERALVESVSGKNELLKDALYRKLEMLRVELSGPSPSVLERLLVERVMACWLQVYSADVLYAQNLGKLTPSQSEFFQRRQDRAHRRFLSAIRSLAQVRRLLFPAVQVNIGAQQVNAMQVVAESRREP